MAIKEIHLLGNPLLTLSCAALHETELPLAIKVGKDLHDTMMDFRLRNGWGRAIAAPQIGILKRVAFVNVDKPWLIINPEISARSEEMVEVWDDCMSFPDLLVKLQRHVSFTLIYLDDRWSQKTVRIEGVLSELLQHEIDHLDGILSVSRARDGASFALQSQRHLIPKAVFANQPGNSTKMMS